MSNSVPIPLKTSESLQKNFDKNLKGRSRAVVLRKLMQMYSNGYIEINWDKDYSKTNIEMFNKG